MDDAELIKSDSERSDHQGKKENKMFRRILNSVEHFTDKTNGWKFKLSPKLDHGSLSLAPDEYVLTTWRYDTCKMNFWEWFFSIITFGLFYCWTRIYLRRRRFYTLVLTTERLLIKEEMFQSYGFCCLERKLTENQIAYPITAIRYICYEILNSGAFGCLPTSVRLRINVINAPLYDETQQSLYSRKWFIFLEPYYVAMKYGFGIDPRAKPAERTVQFITSSFNLISVWRWILFGWFVSTVFLYHRMMDFLGLLGCFEPMIGIQQVLGTQNGQEFTWFVNIHEDPDCMKHVKEFLSHLNTLLHKKYGSVEPYVSSKQVQSTLHGEFQMQEGMLMDNPLPLHTGNYQSPLKNDQSQGKEHGKRVYYPDMMPLGEEEKIVDFNAINSYFAWEDVEWILTTIGLYACYHLWEKLLHTKSACYLTNTRVLKVQAVVNSSENRMKYFRGECWYFTTGQTATINDRDRGYFGLLANKGYEISIYQKDACLINTDFPTMEMAARVMKCFLSKRKAFANTINIIKEDSLHKNMDLQTAEWTQQLLNLECETVEMCIHAYPRVGCCSHCMNCGMKYVEESCLTFTTQGIYLELFGKTTCASKETRSMFILDWDSVQGIYWSNFDYADSYGACMDQLRCSCFRTLSDRDISPYGYVGSQIRMNLMGNTSFTFGCNIPNRFYGQTDQKVNNLINTFSLRVFDQAKNALVEDELHIIRDSMQYDLADEKLPLMVAMTV